MRKITGIIILFFITLSSQAQLGGTRWSALLNIEAGVNVTFDFGTDTLNVYAEDGTLVETMKYNYADTLLTIEKLSGQSQCDSVAAIYKLPITDSLGTFYPIRENCEDRKTALTGVTMKKE